MAIRINLGMENQILIISEGLLDFEEMMAQGFNLQSVVSQKGWDSLFDMNYGPTYPKCICPRIKLGVFHTF